MSLTLGQLISQDQDRDDLCDRSKGEAGKWLNDDSKSLKTGNAVYSDRALLAFRRKRDVSFRWRLSLYGRDSARAG